MKGGGLFSHCRRCVAVVVIPVLGLIATIGSAGRNHIQLESAPVSEQARFVLKDERSEESRRGEMHSCDLSPASRLPDDYFRPDRIDFFSSRLEATLGDHLNGKEARIQRFDTIVWRKQSCQGEGVSPSLYDSTGILTDPPAVVSPDKAKVDLIICRIDGVIDGKKFYGKSAIPTKEGPTDDFGLQGREQEIAYAVSQAIKASIDDIARQLGVDVQPEIK